MLGIRDSYDIGDDSRKQQILLMLMWTLLKAALANIPLSKRDMLTMMPILDSRCAVAILTR
jgi:hypothetical protein